MSVRFITLTFTLLLATAALLAAPSQNAGEQKSDASFDPIRHLMSEIERLNDVIAELREDLAAAQLEAAEARRERDELQEFIADHERFGQDFQRYQSVRETADRQARQQAARQRLEETKAQRAEQRRQAEERRRQEQLERQRLDDYRQRGFAPLGLDVFMSSLSYSYETVDRTSGRIDYVPGIGHYPRLYPAAGIDYGRMTISGSVLNADVTTRSLGVAITFFDDRGTQVGHEIVQVKNARPDVPYPFTSTITMALDRPFASASQYVLYAD